MSGLASSVKNIYNNAAGWVLPDNNNTASTSLDINNYAPIISQVSSDTNIDEGEIYSAWDVMKSWEAYEEATHYLTDNENSEAALAALENVQGVKAEEIIISIWGRSVTFGTAMDSSGDTQQYVSYGTSKITDTNLKNIILKSIANIGVEFPISTREVYYNAPMDAVINGESETFGGTLGMFAFDVTSIDRDGETYSGISFPVRIGLGSSYSRGYQP
ncbi:MAG: hypothetical protein R3Y32_05475 [Bacillota bacterium]